MEEKLKELMSRWNVQRNKMSIAHVAENLVSVTRKSILSGKDATMEIPARQGQIEYWMHSGENIQDALSWLNADQREFLQSGITPDEWSCNVEGEVK